MPKKIQLTAAQKEKRVGMVRKWICDKIDPDNIVFTNEARFSLDGNDNMYSWIDKNDNSRQLRPYKGGSIMVRGAITKSGQLIVRRIVGTLDSQKYCNLMETDVLPLLKKRLESYILQQDNASCHVSKLTKEMFRRNNVQLLQWPQNSPDLSPIENTPIRSRFGQGLPKKY